MRRVEVIYTAQKTVFRCTRKYLSMTLSIIAKMQYKILAIRHNVKDNLVDYHKSENPWKNKPFKEVGENE